jgi:hypothetical protein
MTPLRVEYELTREDYERTVQAVLDRDPFARRAWRRVKLLLAGYAAVLAALTAAVWAVADEPPVLLVGFTLAVAAWAVWFWPGGRRSRRTSRKYVTALMGTPAGRAYLGKQAVTVGRDGLTVEKRYGSSVVRWAGVFEAIRTPTHLFLVLPGPGYLPVPRTAFEFDEDFARYCDAVADLVAAGRAADPDNVG